MDFHQCYYYSTKANEDRTWIESFAKAEAKKLDVSAKVKTKQLYLFLPCKYILYYALVARESKYIFRTCKLYSN